MARSVFLLAWTLWTSFVAIVLHFLLLGIGDPGMWYGRRVWWPILRRVAGMRVELEGALPAGFHGPCVVVANHQGYLDIPIVIGLLDLQLRFIFKRELFLIPFFGWYLFAAG
ncbi:MAG: 1-acyl-sn-glycerol-3-phosphate acyltransferase, partial [Planctomycetes bacterium]|nr:1-acyl-sn-glycerol-3-phosphate acyltransferase [Planctomycetota bacterium]